MNQAHDTERATGSILSALIQFPTLYTFTVVGKTNGNHTLQHEFVAAVQAIVRASTSGSSGSETSRTTATATTTAISTTDTQVTPRGNNYVKVTIEAPVESASVITLIYQQLAQLERCVMQF